MDVLTSFETPMGLALVVLRPGPALASGAVVVTTTFFNACLFMAPAIGRRMGRVEVCTALAVRLRGPARPVFAVGGIFSPTAVVGSIVGLERPLVGEVETSSIG